MLRLWLAGAVQRTRPTLERAVTSVRNSFFNGEDFVDLEDARRRAKQSCATAPGYVPTGRRPCVRPSTSRQSNRQAACPSNGALRRADLREGEGPARPLIEVARAPLLHANVADRPPGGRAGVESSRRSTSKRGRGRARNPQGSSAASWPRRAALGRARAVSLWRRSPEARSAASGGAGVLTGTFGPVVREGADAQRRTPPQANDRPVLPPRRMRGRGAPWGPSSATSFAQPGTAPADGNSADVTLHGVDNSRRHCQRPTEDLKRVELRCCACVHALTCCPGGLQEGCE